MIINDLAYHIEESGAGETLILLHGFTGCVENWQHIIEPLSEVYHVVCVDFIGHGKSAAPIDPARYRLKNVRRDLIKLIKAMSDETVHLLGYSMGGRIALYLAVNHPTLFRSLILESASPGLEDDVARMDRRNRDNALAERIEQDGIEAFVDYWESLPLWESQQQLSDEKRLALREQRLANKAVGLANSLRGMGTGVQPSLWGKLTKIYLPTLLIAGETDEKFVGINRQMAEAISYAQLEIIENVGHTVHLEKPDAYVEKVLAFLKTIH